MVHLLDGCHAKLDRAQETFQVLRHEIDAYLSTDPKPIRVEGRRQNGDREFAFVAFGPSAAPLRFGVLAGEVIHQLRSSLDHLINALAIAAGNAPSNNSQFPICTTRDRYRQLCQSGWIKGVSKTAKALVESVQPYHQTPPDNATLKILDQCDNIDKHRLLLVANTAATIGDRISLNSGAPNVTLVSMSAPDAVVAKEEGAEVFKLVFQEPAPNAHAHAQVSCNVVFERLGSVTMPPVVEVLNLMGAEVKRTMALFHAEF